MCGFSGSGATFGVSPNWYRKTVDVENGNLGGSLSGSRLIPCKTVKSDAREYDRSFWSEQSSSEASLLPDSLHSPAYLFFACKRTLSRVRTLQSRRSSSGYHKTLY